MLFVSFQANPEIIPSNKIVPKENKTDEKNCKSNNK